ncbi:hypothetical protein NEISUBOT_05672 [Neisseria subflava NJ9703]|uniref:Uncharacterized protein n=1 Tax=Neisseria subflava NJ9703 TaxID=546268 RepID=A0A9W5INH0_NEISU|nr:hypothetical protein NEISUBOT_05672 [Neisseria subflava NJ9703]
MSTECCMETNLTINLILKNKTKQNKTKRKWLHPHHCQNCSQMAPGSDVS